MSRGLPAHTGDLPKTAAQEDGAVAWQRSPILAPLRLLHTLGQAFWYVLVLSKTASASVLLATSGKAAALLSLRKQHRRVLLLGLDNAGKTALCHLFLRRQGWPSRQARPGHHVLHDEFEYQDCLFSLIDPSCHGGDQRRRSAELWSEMLRSKPQAVVFLVDAADQHRLAEAARSLHEILQHPAARQLPVLILGNKVDLKQAVDEWELKRSLGLAGLCREQRAALLGELEERPSGDTVILPRDLRQRIATFHPDESLSLPHGGPLEVQMCSILKHKAAVSERTLRWISSHASCTSRSCRRFVGALQGPTCRFMSCMGASSSFRHAAKLPLWNHHA